MQRIICFLLFFAFPLVAFPSRISGTVVDDNNTPLAFAVVFIQGTTTGTTTNADGFYFLDLQAGSYQLNFKLIGYQTFEKVVNVEYEDMLLNTKLYPSAIALKEIKIVASDEDPAYAVIRAAQKKRNYYLHQVKEYSCHVFIKGVARITKYPPKKVAGIKVSIGGLIDSTTGIVYLSESESKYYFKQPDKVHEEMLASKTSGMNTGFSYNRASDMDFNFYKATLKNTELSQRGFISPIAPNALRFYRYKLVGTFYEKEEMINKIQVLPKHSGDAIFSGIIYIVENSWRIHSTDLMLDKNTGIQWVDTLHVRQEYLKVNDSIWMPFKNNLEYVYAGMGARGVGSYTGVNSNYKINDLLPAAIFSGEAISFDKDALAKDSSYWNSKRIIPLTLAEEKDYHQRDSMAVIRNSKTYLDSVERVKNKFKWIDIVDGYTYERAASKMKFTFDPMYNNVSFNTVQGVVLTTVLRYNKKITTTKKYEIGGTLGYGFSNYSFYGFGHGTYTYNTKTLSSITLSGGKDMIQFNSNVISPIINTLYTLLVRDNYMKLFEKYYARIEHSTELFNGFIFYAAAEFADRNPLINTTDFSFIKLDKKFLSNDPQNPDNEDFAFVRNQSFHLEGALQYTPFQRFYFLEGEKLIQDSKYPTFTIYYKRAMEAVLGSDVDLDLVKLGMEGNISWKRFGKLHYMAEAGQFTNRNILTFMDWKYFNGNKTLYSNFSGKDYQLLDYYYNSSNNKYAEIHLQQNFDGCLLNKIPVLKRAKIQELITTNFLLTSDKLQYAEVGVGLQKLVIRVDYVLGFSNGYFTNSSLRFGFLF